MLKAFKFLVVAAFAACVVPAQAGVTLSPLDPQVVDQTAASVSSSQTATINFVNNAGVPVDLYWIDYSGNRVLYANILPGGSYLQATYMTHPWVLVESGTGGTTAQGSGRLVTAFLPATAGADGLSADIANITFYAAHVPALTDAGLLVLALALVALGGRRLTRRTA